MLREASSFIARGNILWDDGLLPVPDGRLLVEGGKIRRLLLQDEEIEDYPPVLDYSGCTILPGLIDTHCHLTLPGDGRDVDEFLRVSSDEELVEVGLTNARQALRGGVTTLRDLGARAGTGFDLVDRLAGETGASPRLIVSGPVLTRPHGHGWAFGLQVAGAEAISAAVGRLHESGAGVIKVMASGGSTPGTETWRAAMPVSDLKAAVEAAHAIGLPIAAHVSCPAAAELCLEAGIDDLEHLNLWADSSYGNRVDLALLGQIKDRDVFVGPTLQTPYRVLRDEMAAKDARGAIRAKLYEDVLSNFQVFTEIGLRIIAGSDAGFLITRFDELHLGLRIMVENGLSAQDAILSATVTAAEALGLHSTIGSIRPGMDADLLVVEGNPLDSVVALQNTRAVFVEGQQISL